MKLTDQKFVYKLIEDHEKHPNFINPKFVTKNPLLFGVRHSAGHVGYSADSFIVKNGSELPAEVLRPHGDSAKYVMQQLAQDLDKLRGQMGGAKKTVSSLFRKGLQTLIHRLGCAEASFIRGMKPNPQIVPHKGDGDIVLDQLSCLVPFETVKIRQKGIPDPSALGRLRQAIPQDHHVDGSSGHVQHREQCAGPRA